ncbi:MAG: tetratricopeptide repeat protein [Polyangiales bacterium]
MLSDDAFREQLLDYLYDTLPADARAVFERALAESPARRAEVDAMRATLARARTGLAALAEEPPARVRDAVIAEARRASERGKARPLRSLHAARRTASWLVPALGVAAAVALVVQRRGDDAGAPMRTPEAHEAPAEAPAPAPPGGTVEPVHEAPPREGAPSSGGAAPARRRAAPSAKPKGEAARRGMEGLGGAAPESSGARSEEKARGAHAREAEQAAPAAAPAPADRAAEPSAAKRDEATPRHAPDLRVHAAEQLVREGRHDEAMAAYRALLARFPNDPRAEAWRAVIASQRDASR